VDPDGGYGRGEGGGGESISKLCKKCGKKLNVYPPFKVVCPCSVKRGVVPEVNKNIFKAINLIPRKRKPKVPKKKTKNQSQAAIVNRVSNFQRSVYHAIMNTGMFSEIIMEHPIKIAPGIIKTVDIYIPERKLIVECDGGFWHTRKEYLEKDLIRQTSIEKLGYRMVRVGQKEWNLDDNIFRYI
jgi:very-short-patch-repair endonuclease